MNYLQEHKIWLSRLNEEVSIFLDSLKKNTSGYSYFPARDGLTEYGSKLELGFSCYALKVKYTLNNEKYSGNNHLYEWSNYLNKFQKNSQHFPENSYIDNNFLKFHNEFILSKFTKNTIKKLLNKIGNYNYLTAEEALANYIKAESKQAISTLYEINSKNKKPYVQFPNSKKDIHNYLTKLDWKYPWNAGAQYAALCLFTATQDIPNKNESIKELSGFIKGMVNIENGCYSSKGVSNKSELVNGSMKVLTGLDWINMEIHFPNNLIDYCLNIKPNSEGCDLVDVVYVLYRCSLETTYKSDEVKEYLNNLVPIIKTHYIEKDGGFSYFKNKSQTHYYGLNITKGLNTADLHGTVLLVWALSMILSVLEYEKMEWNVLKP